MINQQTAFLPAELEWMLWSTEIRQRVLAVVAATRYAWASRVAADEPVIDRDRFAHPLFRLALDAKNNSFGRVRGVRARYRRRAALQFTT